MLLSMLLAGMTLPVQEPQQEVLNSTVHHFKHLGRDVVEMRVLDRTLGTIRSEVFFDDGTPVELGALHRAERNWLAQNGGKVSHELRERMNAAQADENLLVVFWLQVDETPDFRQTLRDAKERGVGTEDARRMARDQAVQFYAQGNTDFAERLTAAGIEVEQVGGPWPIVFAEVPVHSIETWANDSAVDTAYFSFPTWEAELNHAQGTMRTPIVWDMGITGTGSTVRTMVNDPGHVSTSNPNLPPITLMNSGSSSSHASGCAGNIGFDHPTYKGAAFAIPGLWSAAGSGDTNAPIVWNQAITLGIDFGNCSWWNFNKGAIVFLDRFFDHTLRNFGMMMFKSTGNQGNTSTPYTTTPGNGYNSTNSGAYNDGNNTSWPGDSMASYSSYWDPVEGHEKPELANAGDDVTTAGTSSTQGFGGTSSASPLTCGVATLMATADPSLRSEPETIKSILMSSAWHNIEGDDVLSERDGAGGVHALAAINVVLGDKFQNGTLTNSSFNASGHFEVPFQAYAGDTTRVCALWFSTANSSYTTDTLEMDVDLVILNPANVVVATSANSLNPFEILKFTPTMTGTHTARLVRQRFNGTSEGYCVSWSSQQDRAVGQITHSGNPRPGGSLTLNFKDRYRSFTNYQAYASLNTLPNVFALNGGFVLPLKQDKAFNFSGSLPGFSGTLNSAGEATATASIPNKSSLSGRDAHFAFYTFSGSTTQSTSPVYTVRIN